MTKPRGLDDYVDVAERAAAFFERYPDGRLVPHRPWRLEQVGEKLFLVYEAAAYRGPEDTTPGVGTAWEPVPGGSAFTRDSELMNAETAAWGRAMIAVGIPSRKIASLQEVRARVEPEAPAPPPPRPASPGRARPGATDAQRKRIHAMISERAITRFELGNVLSNWGIALQQGWMDKLTPGRDGTASQLIDELGRFNGKSLPDVESDIPADLPPAQERVED